MTVDAKTEALRDAIFDLMQNAKHEIDGAMASLNVSDDVGFNHHAKRLFDALRIVHAKLKELPHNAN